MLSQLSGTRETLVRPFGSMRNVNEHDSVLVRAEKVITQLPRFIFFTR